MEFPHLQTFQKEYTRKGFEVLSIGNLKSIKGVEDYVVKQGLQGEEPLFPVLIGGWKIYKAYKGRGTPNTFILDRNGNVRFYHRNFYEGNEKQMKREIEFLLAET